MKLLPIKEEVKLEDLGRVIHLKLAESNISSEVYNIDKMLSSLICKLIERGILDKEDIQDILNITLIED